MKKYTCKYYIEVKDKPYLTGLDFSWEKNINFQSEVNDANELKTNTIKFIKEKTIADLILWILDSKSKILEDNAEKRKLILGVAAWWLKAIHFKFDEDFILKIKSIEEC